MYNHVVDAPAFYTSVLVLEICGECCQVQCVGLDMWFVEGELYSSSTEGLLCRAQEPLSCDVITC
jgi:hypothetical protein